VIEAVKDDKFHIYPVSSIDEGITILTGRKAGIRTAAGQYPKNTVYSAITKKIKKYAQLAKAFTKAKKISLKTRKKR